MREDVEWARLATVPGVLDSWADVKEKFGTATEEFKVGANPSEAPES